MFLILINIFKVPIIALFTDEKEIVSMVYRLLLFPSILNLCSINLVTISALKVQEIFAFLFYMAYFPCGG